MQDANTARVLMLGYMNEESLRRTQETGWVTFFSRSKQRLWKKGESSGNTLRLVSAAADCDGDAILVRAVPAGPTCHTGETSCFAAEELGPETLGELVETIRSRCGKRIGSVLHQAAARWRRRCLWGESARGGRGSRAGRQVRGQTRTIEEAADVLYHLFVLLRGQRIELGDVAQELQRRRR